MSIDEKEYVVRWSLADTPEEYALQHTRFVVAASPRAAVKALRDEIYRDVKIEIRVHWIAEYIPT